MKFSGLKTLLLSAVLATGAAAANAAVTIEDFGTSNKLPDPYTNQGYTYTPTHTSNGQCFGGVCLKEAGSQGLLTNLTSSTKGEAFDLLGFYVNFDGKGSGNNYLKITGTNGSSTTVLDLAINTDYSVSTSPILLYKQDGTATSMLDKKSAGFFVIFKNDLFDNMTSIKFNALGSANVRMDCVAASKDGSNVSISGLSTCKADVSAVPVPATLPLLAGAFGLAGLGGAALRRKSKKA